MASKYGIPYMGSKNSILKNICSIFPKAENFYDLFGGGFSVTHFMIERRTHDYKFFHFNEIRSGMTELIQDAINGKYSYENFKPEFITREEFFKRKESDLYVKLFWSFGNNGETYLFGKDIEKEKESFHNAVVFNQFDEFARKTLGIEKFADGYDIKSKRLFLRNKIKNYQLQQLERLEQLEQLERLEQLQQLERLHKLNFYNTDYKNVPIKENSVIYCDPPYLGTEEYDGNKNFNHLEFYEWAHNQENPVFISEYKLPDRRFTEIRSFKKMQLLNNSQKSKSHAMEKIFVNKSGIKALLKNRKMKK